LKSLKRKVFNGIAWRSSADFGQMILLIAFTAVLARLLNRADFGLVAMALLVNRFIRSITQIGFGTAIIQSQEVTEAKISAVFIIQVGINFLVSLICFLGAPLAAIFFNEPRLEQIIRVLAWLIVIDSLGFPTILMKKKVRFGGISILEISSMVAGNIVGIYLALKGFGAWALVFRLLTQHILSSTIIWSIVKWRPVWPDFKGIGKLFRFGIHMLGSNVCYYFSQNLAAIIIGKFIGLEMLGSFNIAYNLAILPAQKISSVLSSVLTPAFCQIQQDLNKLREKFFASIFSLGFLYIPLMMGLSAVAQNFIIVVYGEKWKEAGLFLTFLALLGMLKGIEHLLRSVIIARGWSSVIFKITVAETVASIPLLFLGSYYFGVMGLIIAYMIASFFSFFLNVRAAQNSLDDKRIFFRAIFSSFGASCAFYFLVLGYHLFFPKASLINLIIQIGVGALVYIGIRLKIMTNKERSIFRSFPLISLVFAQK